MSPNSEPDELDTPIAATAAKVPTSRRRYLAGMLIYGVLALLAGVTLTGDIRVATWIFLGGLALKTWIAVLKDPMA